MPSLSKESQTFIQQAIYHIWQSEGGQKHIVITEIFRMGKMLDMAYKIAGVANLIHACIKFASPHDNHPHLYLPPSQGEEV